MPLKNVQLQIRRWCDCLKLAQNVHTEGNVGDRTTKPSTSPWGGINIFNRSIKIPKWKKSSSLSLFPTSIGDFQKVHWNYFRKDAFPGKKKKKNLCLVKRQNQSRSPWSCVPDSLCVQCCWLAWSAWLPAWGSLWYDDPVPHRKHSLFLLEVKILHRLKVQITERWLPHGRSRKIAYAALSHKTCLAYYSCNVT